MGFWKSWICPTASEITLKNVGEVNNNLTTIKARKRETSGYFPESNDC